MQNNDELRIATVERSRKIRLRVNGEEIEAFAGETVMAALLAAGIRGFKTSHVLGQPRGPLCGMGVCYECQLTINGSPGQRACMVEADEGMEIETRA